MTDEPNKGQEDSGQEDNSVPLAALQAETRKRQDAERRLSGLENTVAELRGRLEGMSTASSPAKEPVSRAELLKAVEEEKISQEEADKIWERQIKQAAAEEARKEASRLVSGEATKTRIQSQISRYQAALPDLSDRDSANWQKVSREFNTLVSDMGYSADELRTELAALRSAFGPIEALESTVKAHDREGHRETGGRSEPEGKDRQDGYPRGMPDYERAHYDELISKGYYKDKEDPKFKRHMERWKAKQDRRRRAA